MQTYKLCRVKRQAKAPFIIFFMLVQIGAANHSSAEGIEPSRFRFSGFTTLGVVKGGDEDLGFTQDLNREGVFDGDMSFKSNSNLGLQLDATIDRQWSVGVQVIAEDRVENSLAKSLNWAFIRYRFSPNTTVKLGRLSTDIFMLSEYRKTGFAYLWVRPPSEFYTPVAFDHFDGMDMTYSSNAGSGTFTGKVQIGNTKNTFSRDGESYDLKISPSASISLTWENELWLYRASIAAAKLDADQYLPGTEPLAAALETYQPFWPEATYYLQSLEAKDARFDYYSIGIAYTPELWQVKSEINYVKTDIGAYGDLYGGYLSVGRNIGPTTVYAMAAKSAKTNNVKQVSAAPPGLEPLQDGLQFFYSSINIDQVTGSLGVRWDVRYDTAIKAQWDRTSIAKYSAGLWDQRNVLEKDRILNTYTININYVF